MLHTRSNSGSYPQDFTYYLMKLKNQSPISLFTNHEYLTYSSIWNSFNLEFMNKSFVGPYLLSNTWTKWFNLFSTVHYIYSLNCIAAKVNRYYTLPKGDMEASGRQGHFTAPSYSVREMPLPCQPIIMKHMINSAETLSKYWKKIKDIIHGSCFKMSICWTKVMVLYFFKLQLVICVEKFSTLCKIRKIYIYDKTKECGKRPWNNEREKKAKTDATADTM